MTDREKLIEILRLGMDKYFLLKFEAEIIAELLIANGVTFAKDTDVPSKWISVEEQQPKGEVLAFSSECCEMLIGYVHGDGTVDGWCCESDEETLYGVTHWMPLPEPPKED